MIKNSGHRLYVCDNWKPSFLHRLIFNCHTFSRRVTARWRRQWAKNQVSTNQNPNNRWRQIVSGTICKNISNCLRIYYGLWESRCWKLLTLTAIHEKVNKQNLLSVKLCIQSTFWKYINLYRSAARSWKGQGSKPAKREQFMLQGTLTQIWKFAYISIFK